jgi:hypothetical protein
MKIIITLLRIVLGILLGCLGSVVLLNAPYQLLNTNFRFTDGGPLILVSLMVGGLMVWAAWRLIRGRRIDSPAA